MNYPSDAALTFEALPIETITLDAAQVEQAKQLAGAIEHDSRQWQAYLNTLALFALEQWLGEWAAELNVNLDACSVFQPPYAEVLGAACNAKVGEFRLCIIPMGSVTEDEIALPRAVVELPEFAAHFYLVIEAIEELNKAIVWGFMRYDRLISQLAAVGATAEEDWTYSVPIEWLERQPEDLLLYLRCLNPQTLPLPARSPQVARISSSLAADLAPLRARLQSPEWELWEVLTWEQGAALLQDPEALNALLTPAQPVSPFAKLQSPIQTLEVNVGLWLRDEMDELTRQLSWILLPAFNTEAAAALRSPTQELQGLIQQLEHDGRSVPSVARSAYSDLKLANIPLRLYAVTWSFVTQDNRPAWMLLLILGTQPGSGSRHGIKLAIADKNEILLERQFEADTEESYLYAQVAGTLDEVFTIHLSSNNGAALTLPPFTFRV